MMASNPRRQRATERLLASVVALTLTPDVQR
jgi:hypothetical protein